MSVDTSYMSEEKGLDCSPIAASFVERPPSRSLNARLIETVLTSEMLEPHRLREPSRFTRLRQRDDSERGELPWHPHELRASGDDDRAGSFASAYSARTSDGDQDGDPGRPLYELFDAGMRDFIRRDNLLESRSRQQDED